MISVRCLGHIGTSVGTSDVQIDAQELRPDEIVERVRSLCRSSDPGFTRFNILLMIEDGEAFVPAGSARTVKSGERVALIPFSHGG